MSPPFQERAGAGHAPPLTPHLCALPREQHNWHIREKAILNRHQINVPRDFVEEGLVFFKEFDDNFHNTSFHDSRAHNDLSGLNRRRPRLYPLM